MQTECATQGKTYFLGLPLTLVKIYFHWNAFYSYYNFIHNTMGITQCIPPGTQVMVKRVDIVNRSVLGDRTRNINIRVGDQLPGYKYKKTSTWQIQIQTVACAQNINNRVGDQLQGYKKLLTRIQVQIQRLIDKSNANTTTNCQPLEMKCSLMASYSASLMVLLQMASTSLFQVIRLRDKVNFGQNFLNFKIMENLWIMVQ